MSAWGLAEVLVIIKILALAFDILSISTVLGVGTGRIRSVFYDVSIKSSGNFSLCHVLRTIVSCIVSNNI